MRERADGEPFDPRWEAVPPTAKNGWTQRGRVPVASLRFEHHERVCDVERRSLERALASLA